MCSHTSALVIFSVLLSLSASLPTVDDQSGYCDIGDQRLRPGQRAPDGNYVYECQFVDGNIQTKVVSCLDGNIFYSKGASGSDPVPRGEHGLGESWVEGDPPFRFILLCKEINNVAIRRFDKCFYDSKDGQAKLNGGEQQKVGKTLVKCERSTEFGLHYDMGNNSTSSNGQSKVKH